MNRRPKLKIMLAHGGGFTPYRQARWEHGWKVRPEPKKNVPTQPKGIAKRFTTTPSCIPRRRWKR